MSSENLAYDVWVNGERREIRAPASATLLEVLRTRLELTGTKRGCNHGVCGACTVQIDGRPARACLTLALDLGERRVTTIEGVNGEAPFSAIQKALVESGAIQCGFCTPGVVMALTALFAQKPKASREEIRRGLSGNLCRCSGYVKIVAAAESLVESSDA